MRQPAQQREVLASVCPHDCPSTCALEVEVLDGLRIGAVHGAAANSYTSGVICSKVARYAERIHHPDRLTQPLMRTGPKGSTQFRAISWEEALDRVAGGDGRGDGDGSGVLFFDGQHRCLGGCAGGQAVIHEEDRLAGEGGAASGVESSAVGGQAFFFFFDDRVQLRLEAGVEEGGSLIQDYDIALGQGAEGKLAMNGMPDFPHDQHVQRELEHLRYGGGDHHPAPRQTQHEVGLDLLVLQVLPQLASRIFTRCEYHRVSPG